MAIFKRRYIFQTIILGIYVRFRGCTLFLDLFLLVIFYRLFLSHGIHHHSGEFFFRELTFHPHRRVANRSFFLGGDGNLEPKYKEVTTK